MNNNTSSALKSNSIVGDAISWIFGILFLAIGVVNVFWGNDFWFGVFISLLSFVFFPPMNVFLKSRTGFSSPVIAKICVGLFILWASTGVGELFDKIEMMQRDF